MCGEGGREVAGGYRTKNKTRRGNVGKNTSPAFVSCPALDNSKMCHTCSDLPALSMVLPAGFWLDTRARAAQIPCPQCVGNVLETLTDASRCQKLTAYCQFGIMFFTEPALAIEHDVQLPCTFISTYPSLQCSL